LFILILAAIVASILLWPEGEHTPFWHDCQRVQLGMTYDQVLDILGPPDLEYFPAGIVGPRALIWTKDKEGLSLDLDRGTVYSQYQNVEVVSKKNFTPKTLWERLGWKR
jgi:hypothetical protein